MQATLNDINAALNMAAQADRDHTVHAVDVHPFQRVGLGRAPFACVDCQIGGTKCAYCGTAIVYEYSIKGADGKVFVVGSECVKQTGGAVAGFEQFNRAMLAKVRRMQADARAAKQASKAAEEAAAWKAAHPEEFAYMQKRAQRGSGFYSYLVGVVDKFGSVFDSKLESVRRDMAEDARRAAAVPAPAAAKPVAPVVNLEPVEAAFAKAKAAGIKWPKLRLGGFVFSPAGDNSANAGAIYIKTRTGSGEEPGAYMGKVLGGRFLRVRECDAKAEAEILAIAADPKASAVAYGKAFGKCSVCNRDLTDAESVAAGIGPVCAGRYGF